MSAKFAGLAVLFLLGCAEGTPVATSSGAGEHRKLEQAKNEHAALVKQLSEAPADHVASCKLTAGDCTLQVAEERSRLVSALRLDPCESAPDSEAKSTCIVAQLAPANREHELTDYLSLESWCLGKLTACVASKADEDRVAALDARYAGRKRELENAPGSVKARGAVALTRARVEYLRATLPPNTTGVCKPDANVESCLAPIKSEQAALLASMKTDGYDAKAALETYASTQQAEAACGKPELDCLSGILSSYGVYPESRKWVDRNLDLLSQRQDLLGQVSDDAKTRCVASAQKEMQSEIVSSYVAYVRQPVLFFRMQLDKSFMKLHESEVGCLQARAKAMPQKGAVAVTTK